MVEMELSSACHCHAFSFLISKGSPIIEIMILFLKNKGMESWKLPNHRPSALASSALHSPSFSTASSLLSATSPPAWSLPSQAALVDLFDCLQAPSPQPCSCLSQISALTPSLPSLDLRPRHLIALGHLFDFALDPALSPALPLTPPSLRLCHRSCSCLSAKSQPSLCLHLLCISILVVLPLLAISPTPPSTLLSLQLCPRPRSCLSAESWPLPCLCPLRISILIISPLSAISSTPPSPSPPDDGLLIATLHPCCFFAMLDGETGQKVLEDRDGGIQDINGPVGP